MTSRPHRLKKTSSISSSRNVAIYITLDYIVRQTENLAFINYQLLVINRRMDAEVLKMTICVKCS